MPRLCLLLVACFWSLNGARAIAAESPVDPAAAQQAVPSEAPQAAPETTSAPIVENRDPQLAPSSAPAPVQTQAQAPAAIAPAPSVRREAPVAQPAPVTQPTQVSIAQPVGPSTAELTARIALMEQLLVSQRDREVTIYRDTNRLITIFGISFAVIGMLGLIGAGYLNYRGMIAVQQGMPRFPVALPAPGRHPETISGNVPGIERVQASGQRFQAQMSSLEERLREMEQMTGLRHPSPPARSEPPPEHADAIDTEVRREPEPRRVVPLAAILVHKAETLINLGKHLEALATLDQATQAGDGGSEVHMARGRALEKMGRLGDALKAYELAVNVDERSTSALLMKAGVLNRQERFAEALICYEQALAIHRATT